MYRGDYSVTQTRKKSAQLFCIAFHWNVHLVLGSLQASDYPDGKHNGRHTAANTDTRAPGAEIIYRGMKIKLETEKPLGTETLRAA